MYNCRVIHRLLIKQEQLVCIVMKLLIREVTLMERYDKVIIGAGLYGLYSSIFGFE